MGGLPNLDGGRAWRGNWGVGVAKGWFMESNIVANSSASGHTRTGSSLRLLPFGDKLVGRPIPFGWIVLDFCAMGQS